MTRASLFALALLCGCSAISAFERDATRLAGEVPSGLGRVVLVAVEGADEQLAADLLAALEREFTGHDLFDEVRAASPGETEQAPRLFVTVLSAKDDEIYDLFLIKSAYGCRYEFEVELRSARGEPVLSGHVTAIGLDDVTEFEFLSPEKRRDVRLAAVEDGAMKISRGLRRAANQRAFDALRAMPEFGLPAGVAPLSLAVLGVDDPPGANRIRGREFADHLSEAMSYLGPDFDVLSRPDALRAVEREPPVHGFWALADYEAIRLGRHLPAVRVYVVGRLRLEDGRVEAQARVLDRKGKALLERSAVAEGLGALQLAAVALAERLGEALQSAPLGPPDEHE
ncbi:MAG: hypothetical protein D6731_19480 [Planctomycetota bacterium]|nr:MAG: hypothetical protein D6731_19480 [Planctomycetota bacterium]